MRNIQTKPEPSCPISGAHPMKLRRPKPGDSWPPFWSCKSWPDCDGTLEIGPDGKPETDLDWLDSLELPI
jgi:ssDNA-binding Zn-finger/Zn-ribbon topoisomerase 1